MPLVGALLIAILMLPALPASALDCMSARGSTVAVWCARAPSYGATPLTVSDDDGVTWTDVGIEVEGGCVDDVGVVHAIVNDPRPHLLRYQAGALAASAAPIPVETAYAIGTIDDALYVIGAREQRADGAWDVVLLASDDAGARWRELAVLPGFGSLSAFSVSPSAHGSARLRVLSSEGLSCFGTVRERLYAYERGRLTSALLVDDVACANDGQDCANLDVVGLGAHGSAYGLVRSGESDVQRLALVAATERLSLLPLRTASVVMVGHNGRITLALVGERLVRLEGSAARVLDRHAPPGADALYVDPRGRAWAIVGQQLLRFSRGRGFETIPEPSRRGM